MIQRGRFISEKIVYLCIILVVISGMIMFYQYIKSGGEATADDNIAKAKVNENSATILKSQDESAVLVVPKGTSTNVEEISIQKIENAAVDSDDRVSSIYKFGPSEAEFNQPVELRIQYYPEIYVENCPTKLEFYHYRDDGKIKEIVPSEKIYCNINTAVFKISSFSEGYASFPGNAWPTSSPESQGMSSERLRSIPSNAIDDAVVIKNGYEVWRWGNVVTSRGAWSSVTRSYLTTAWGMAITDGSIPGGLSILDQPVRSLDSSTARSYDSNVKLKHLLSYTSCRDPPGSQWAYSCGQDWFDQYQIFKEVTGKTVHDYLNQKLFPVLGGNPGLKAKPCDPGDTCYDERGQTNRIDGSPRDHARWGYFWMNNGNWNGRQLVDTQFVTRSISPGPDGTGRPNPNEGWQIHLNKNGRAIPGCPNDAFAAAGGTSGRAFILVVPSLNLVVARHSTSSDLPDEGIEEVAARGGPICQAVTSDTTTPSLTQTTSSVHVQVGNCDNSDRGSDRACRGNPDITSVSPTSLNAGDTLTINGRFLTRTVQFIDSNGIRNSYNWAHGARMNRERTQVTIPIPADLPSDNYKVRTWTSRTLVSNEVEITIAGTDGPIDDVQVDTANVVAEKNLGGGTFPDVAWLNGRLYLAVQQGQAGQRKLKLYNFASDLTDQQVTEIPFTAGQAFPRMTVSNGILWLAYRDGDNSQGIKESVKLWRSDTQAIEDLGGGFGNDPIAIGNGYIAWQKGGKVQRRLLEGGEIVAMRDDLPTGISRILPDGSIKMIDEDRSAIPGYTRPWWADDLVVAEGKSDSGIVGFFGGDFSNPSFTLWEGKISFTPHAAADGNGLYAVTTWNGPGVRVAVLRKSTAGDIGLASVLKSWTPTQTTNGKNPQLSPDGRFVTYGFGENWVADLENGEERTFGTGHNGWWIANDKYTYIKELTGSGTQRYEVKIGEWISNLVNDDSSLVAGNQFVAADGHWASWLSGNGRIAYDNEVLGTDLGGQIWVSENQLVHSSTNKDEILVYTNKQNTKTYTSQVTVNELRTNKGYIVYGGLGPMHGITPDGQDVDLTIAPWRIENFGQVFFVDNAPWVASSTFDTTNQKGYIMLRPWGQNDGILVEANVTFGLHVVYYNNNFVVAYSDNNGKLNVVWVKKGNVVNLVSTL